ncbi:MAG: TRAP transporter small permease subunit [Proteobacteria bacterium]|nr:TRAP transporter small permease subunit [Pseudomonadota bacterium]
MAGLFVVVVIGVGFRTAGAALVWYDEVASIGLAWLTYYGAALAALKRAHIGVPGLVAALERPWRLVAVATAEALVIGFFALVAWIGWRVLEVLEGGRLVSLPWVPEQFTQSIIPVGAVVFIVAQLASLPEIWRAAARPDPTAAALDTSTE